MRIVLLLEETGINWAALISDPGTIGFGLLCLGVVFMAIFSPPIYRRLGFVGSPKEEDD